MTTGDYEFFNVVVGVIGNVAGSGWGTDFDMTTTDGITYTLLNQAFLVDGSQATPDPEARLKIRDNHSWNVNFGTSGGDGSNALALTGTAQNGKNGGGGNIFIPYGTYDVSFNRTTGAWAFTLKSLAVNKFDAGSFKVYPNPAKTSWNITSNDDITSVQVYDMLGKSVYAKTASSKEVTVNAADLSKGVYFAKVSTANGSSTVKLVKE
ncbi:MAG: T9SS type A sorting domain-containing protein [Lentimicrobium sp.]|nr:T9SS type A sorting domain-containing protein [Lentimicrobium sp.]